MSSNVYKSAFKMDCFVCKSKIAKGEEITQCIENKSQYHVQLRNKKVGGRWVHMFCLPANVKTQFYVETITQLMDDYPTMTYEMAKDCIDALDYWTLEK